MLGCRFGYLAVSQVKKSLLCLWLAYSAFFFEMKVLYSGFILSFYVAQRYCKMKSVLWDEMKVDDVQWQLKGSLVWCQREPGRPPGKSEPVGRWIVQKMSQCEVKDGQFQTEGSMNDTFTIRWAFLLLKTRNGAEERKRITKVAIMSSFKGEDVTDSSTSLIAPLEHTHPLTVCVIKSSHIRKWVLTALQQLCTY